MRMIDMRIRSPVWAGAVPLDGCRIAAGVHPSLPDIRSGPMRRGSGSTMPPRWGVRTARTSASAHGGSAPGIVAADRAQQRSPERRGITPPRVPLPPDGRATARSESRSGAFSQARTSCPRSGFCFLAAGFTFGVRRMPEPAAPQTVAERLACASRLAAANDRPAASAQRPGGASAVWPAVGARTPRLSGSQSGDVLRA